MKFFLGPKKLMELYKNSGDIAAKLKAGKDKQWYFSAEGEAAYKSASTQGKKVLYFFDYLCILAGDTCNAEEQKNLYRMAHIMANSMDGSKLDFGGYPNILQAEKNPFIKLVEFIKFTEKGFSLNKYDRYKDAKNAIKLLSALHGVSEDVYAENKAFTRLATCSADGSVTDIYKLERDIIGTYCCDKEKNELPAYLYESPVIPCDDECECDFDEDDEDKDF